MEKIICPNCEGNNSVSSKYCSSCGYALPKASENEKVVPAITKAGKPKYKKNSLGIIAGVLTFFISFYAVQHIFFGVPAYNKVMTEMASEINKTCPFMVDNMTRLDNVLALPENIFQYNYTLLTMEKDSVDTSEMQHSLEPFLINMVKTNPDMKFQREYKTTLNYYYKDKNGNYLFKISVTPEKYLR